MRDSYIENQNKVYNLPFKCAKKIDTLSENYAFWIFLLICIIEILYIIGINILTLGSLRKISIRKGLLNDEFFIEKPPNALCDEKDDISSTSTSKKELTKNISGVRIYMSSISYQEKYGKNGNLHDENLISCIIFNFKELHPLWSFFRVSIISPLILRSWFFIFNTLILFGFNALIYWEGLIEKRIYDKKRNRFDYPMRKEFGKILLCILLQIVVTGLIKLLVFVFPEQKRTLEGGLKNFEIKLGREADNNIIVRIDQLEKEMFIRRLIGGVLMLFIVIFFFYYSVVFCGIYINTQKNWIYAGIWSLFWNWFIFAPIYIIVISFLEMKNRFSNDKKMTYYLKGLFFF